MVPPFLLFDEVAICYIAQFRPMSNPRVERLLIWLNEQ